MIAAGFTHTRQLFADTVLAVIAAPNDAAVSEIKSLGGNAIVVQGFNGKQ